MVSITVVSCSIRNTLLISRLLDLRVLLRYFAILSLFLFLGEFIYSLGLSTSRRDLAPLSYRCLIKIVLNIGGVFLLLSLIIMTKALLILSIVNDSCIVDFLFKYYIRYPFLCSFMFIIRI